VRAHDDDRDGPAQIPGGEGSQCARGHDDVDVQTQQLTGKIRELVGASVREPDLDDDALAFHIAEIAQPVSKRLDPGLRRQPRPQEADPPDLHTRLRPSGGGHGQRPERHFAEERAPGHYWMSSSARTRSDWGIVKPRAFAVFILMTNSNLVGCSTGRSAGFAPLRILST